jgi:serine/threonine-protein kinase
MDATTCPVHGSALPKEHHRIRPAAAASSAPAAPFGAVLQGRLGQASEYALGECIGEGASSWIFLAHERPSGAEVAVKLAKPSGDRKSKQSQFSHLSRLEQEACLTLAMRHPHVCRVLDFGRSDDGTPFLVMERLRGRTLDALLGGNGRLPTSVALAIGAQIASGVAMAHSLGIAHRDIKPSNIFLVKRTSGDPRASEPLAKLLDFGLAKAPADRRFVSTRPGFAVGTPCYMSPEVIRGASADFRSDLWALGVTLFEMLAGTHPFPDSNPRVYSWPALRNDPLPIERLAPGIPLRIRRLLDAALQKDPARRVQKAELMVEELAGAFWELSTPAHLSLESSEGIPVVYDLASTTGSSTTMQWEGMPPSSRSPNSSSMEVTARIEMT